MLCKNQHSPTKNKKPPFRLPLHFTTSSIPPNPHLNHKLPQQKKRKKKENMTILKSFPLPSSPSALQIPNEKEKDSPPSNFFFIAFLASKDPLTNQPWCPDVRAALPILEATFQEPTTSQGAEGEEEGKKEGSKKSTTPPPVVAFIEVGQKTEYVFSFFFPLLFLLSSFLFSHHFCFLLSWGNKTDGKIPTTCSVLNGIFTMYRFWCDMNWLQWQWREMLQQNKSRKWEDWSKGRFWMRDDYKNWSMDDDDDPFIYQNNRGKRRDKGWKKALALCVLFTYSIKKN